MSPRRAIVTGAASGLGRALALQLAAERWHVALADRNTAGAAEVLGQVEALGGTGQVELLDVADAQQWQHLRERLHTSWPRLDLLVNNAGVAGAGEVGDFALEDWRWLLGSTLWGTIHGCHVMLPWLRENPQGAAILNVASVAGLIAPPSMAAYSVAKAGVVALSEAMQAELRGSRVRVTVGCPGFFATQLMHSGKFCTEAQRNYGQEAMEQSSVSAETVARALLKAVRRQKFYAVLPARARWLWRLKRCCPTLLTRLLGRVYGQLPAPRQNSAAD